jgi:hypothetical protein
MTREPKGREKRRYDRVRISSCEKLWNLSEGGAFVASDSPRRLGSVFMFEFKVGHKNVEIKTLAKVIRVLHKPNPKIGEPAGMAIQFLDMAPRDTESLRQYLKEYKLKGHEGPE